MKWIRLDQRQPSVKIDGKKVLVHRIPTDSQQGTATAIHDTVMVKHCLPSETWWMHCPEDPVY